MDWFPLPPAPPMPSGAAPRWLRLATGRKGIELWEDLWNLGTSAGRAVGRAEGFVGASLAFLALTISAVIITLVLRRRRSNA